MDRRTLWEWVESPWMALCVWAARTRPASLPLLSAIADRTGLPRPSVVRAK